MKEFCLIVFLFLLHLKAISQLEKTRFDSISINARNGTYNNVDGIVISRYGKTIFQDYFHEYTKDSLHDSRSAFKSITGILVGIAIDKGYIKNVQQKVYKFFPDYKRPANWDKRKDSMTIEHLLEMKSGFDCEEWNGTKDCEAEMGNTRDWIKFCLDLNLKNKPGSKWDYTSINAMLLGGIIANASHMTVSQFADRFLFKPLGIKRYIWTKDSLGHELTAGNFFILPDDMIKIGELVLNNGIYQKKRIVSSKWIRMMTAKLTEIENFSNVRISKNKEAIPQPTYYGYTWYNEKIVTRQLSYNVVFASGNGGQYIMIVRDINLVVVFTGNSYNSSKSKLPFDIMIRYILPVLNPSGTATKKV